MVEALGGSFELEILEGYPPTVNSDEAAEVMFDAMREMLGEEHVQTAEMSMGAEDFSFMAQRAGVLPAPGHAQPRLGQAIPGASGGLPHG